MLPVYNYNFEKRNLIQIIIVVVSNFFETKFKMIDYNIF